MVRFRYRTPALTGRWRDSRSLAVRDAIQAKQAVEDPASGQGLRWLVPGSIEEEGEAPDPD